MDILEFPQMKQCMDLLNDIYETWGLLKTKLDELDKLAIACKPAPKKTGTSRLSPSKAPTAAQVFGRGVPEKILGVMTVASRKEWLVKDLTAATGYSRDEVSSALKNLRHASKVRLNGRGRYEVRR